MEDFSAAEDLLLEALTISSELEDKRHSTIWNGKIGICKMMQFKWKEGRNMLRQTVDILRVY
jgi:hypothetical protein